MKKRIEIDYELKFFRNPKQLFSEIDDEIVMLSVENGEYYSLDSIGCDIWGKLSNPISYKDLINYLVDSYNITFDNCEQDIRPYIEELLIKGLILKYE